MKIEKRLILITTFIGALVLLSTTGYGQEATGASPPVSPTASTSAKTPPVEQALVPEGVFALQLVEALKMGKAENEAQAENMLSSVGIEPKNGWIAGYPVTPIVIGEIQKGVAVAAEAGKVGMGKDEALKALGDLQAGLGLSIRPGSARSSSASQPAPPASMRGNALIYKYVDKDGVVYYTDRYESIPKEYRGRVETIRGSVQPETSGETVGEGPEVTEVAAPNDSAAVPPPEVINNYYYDQGPPVVTYYAPPEPYYYLYNWVPYPFWWSGFFFSGFFILHDFHRHVFFNHHPFVVTNHFSRGPGQRVFVVDPVHRTLRGQVAGAASFSRGFASSTTQSSARAIVGRSQGGITSSRVSSAPFRSNAVPSSSSLRRAQGPARPNQGSFNNGRAAAPARNFGSPRGAEQRVFRQPGLSERSFSPNQSRVFNGPSSSEGRSLRGSLPGGMGSAGGFRGGGGSGGVGMRGGGGSFGGGFGGHR